IIYSCDEIEKAYLSGRGIITLRGKVDKDQENGRDRIIITEIPYTVNKADMVERIAGLVHEKKLEGISNIRDESNKDGLRVVIDLKRGAQPEVIENQLYKLTNLQTSFSMNMLAIHNGRPKVMGLIELLQAFLDFREEVVTRRCIFELNKARARVHILEGLLKALDHIDEIVALIKASANPPEARDNLMSTFGFSEVQAQAILDMRLQRLTGLEQDKIAAEHNELLAYIKKLEKILSDRKELLKVIRGEIGEIRDKYSDSRRTTIERGAADQIEMEDLIPDEKMVVTMTRKGYIKRTELDKYRTQKRGGVGVKGGAATEDDFIEQIFIASNHASILYFTNTGRVYHTKVYEIPERDRATKGVPIVNIRPLQKDERICAAMVVSDLKADARVMLVTAMAYTKRVMLRDFGNILKTGIIACTLEPADQVISARLTGGKDHVIVATNTGKAIVFPEDQVRVMGRQAQGVRAISLSGKDAVVGMDVITSPDDYVINLTELGFGKKTLADKYPVQKRAGK
ncbi:MAG TPA: DNA gyrase subunit A, partial [Deltaproteobacteria bacterium]|nr:DNA gyrase subunit A [Deltaproteobacteria bacterium]